MTEEERSGFEYREPKRSLRPNGGRFSVAQSSEEELPLIRRRNFHSYDHSPPPIDLIDLMGARLEYEQWARENCPRLAIQVQNGNLDETIQVLQDQAKSLRPAYREILDVLLSIARQTVGVLPFEERMAYADKIRAAKPPEK